MIVCSACGTAPPLDPDEPRPAACLGCGATPTWIQLDAREPWARFSGSFACPSCGLDSPLGELPIDGGARCLHCDAEHPIDLYEVRAILAMGHASCDVALGRVPVGFEHPSMDLRGEPSISTEGELELRMLPGVPLCTACRAPLRVARDGNAEVATCPTCGPLGRYHVVEGAVYDGLSALLCDAYRKEPPARQAPGEGATALTCPGCGAPLPLAPVGTAVSCAYCNATCRVPPGMLARARVTPIWVRFRGDSDAVKGLHRRHQPAR